MASSELYETLKDKLRTVLDELKLLVKHVNTQNVDGGNAFRKWIWASVCSINILFILEVFALRVYLDQLYI